MDFSRFFTQDPSFAHLNAGTRTRVPLEVLDWMAAEYRRSEKNPTEAMFTGYDKLWQVQKRLAAFLGADPHDLFLRNNVTAAFNDFIFALPELPRGELLATGWEYGGTVELAKHWARLHGHEFRRAPLPLKPGYTREELVGLVLGSLSERTRILVVSHVSTGNGAILPIQEIAQGARERGVITLVDGAHAVAAVPVNLAELEAVDFYGGNFHKWFLGPEGTGFGWVYPRWREKLVWKFGGWASEKPPAFYQNFGDRNFETARRFFPGTIDRVPLLALGEVLSFWQQHGAETIRARQRELRDFARQEAEKLGWEAISPSNGGLLGPLVAFRRPKAWTGDATELAHRLYREAKVQLALPEVEATPLVRLSPGVYATESEIQGAFERMQQWVP